MPEIPVVSSCLITSTYPKLASQKNEINDSLVQKGKAMEDPSPSADNDPLTVRLLDPAVPSLYEACRAVRHSPQYYPSGENLQAQVDAYVLTGEKLLDFLEACRANSWERQLFTSAEQKKQLGELGGLILQAFYATKELMQCPRTQLDRFYKQWIDAILRINRFNKSLSSSAPSAAQSSQLFDRLTSNRALSIYTAVGLLIWSYLTGAKLLVVSFFLYMTIPFCISLLGLLGGIGKDCLKYIDHQKQAADSFLEEQVLQPLIELLKQHHLTEKELTQMEHLFSATFNAAQQSQKAAEEAEKAAKSIDMAGQLVGSKLDEQTQELAELREEVRRLSLQSQQAGASVAGGASTVSVKELKQSFSAEAKAFYAVLAELTFLKPEQQHEIMLSFTSAEEKQKYGEFLADLIEGFKARLKPEENLSMMQALSRKGEPYWNSLKAWQQGLCAPNLGNTPENIQKKIEKEINRVIGSTSSPETLLQAAQT